MYHYIAYASNPIKFPASLRVVQVLDGRLWHLPQCPPPLMFSSITLKAINLQSSTDSGLRAGEIP